MQLLGYGGHGNEDVKVDTTLSFLDGYVCKALEAGAVPYKPRVFAAVTLEDVRAAATAGSTLDVSGCSVSDMDILSPDCLSFTSDVPMAESSANTSPWSATGRRKSESIEQKYATLESRSVDSSKQEDVELMKALFSPVSSAKAVKADLVISPDSENVEVASSSPLQQHKATVSKSAELWGIELKRHS
nr:uncharacterized protein LOC119171959 [Rhipicephalus microplus]